MATAAKHTNFKGKKQVSEQLKCPICLEVYKAPRALVCLHTFCEKCLSSYIVKAAGKGPPKSSIQCPMCRKDTAVPSPTKPPTEWARQLPLNFAITPMLESMDSESRKIFCDVCDESDRKTLAESYCIECEQCHCEDCNTMHTRFKSMRKHKIVSIDKMPAKDAGRIDLGDLEYCPIHANKEVEFFCEDDQKLCCSTCAIVDHRSCQHVTEVKKLGKGVIEKDMPQLDTEMEILQTQLEELTVSMETNVTEIEKQALEIPKKMIKVRNEVVSLFDKMVSSVTAECGQLKKQHITEIEDKITSNRSLEAAITSSRSLLQALVKKGDETKAFIVFQKLKEQVFQYQKQMKSVVKATVTVTLKLGLDKVVGTVVQSSTPIARIIVETKQQVCPIAECNIEKLTVTQLDINYMYNDLNYRLKRNSVKRMRQLGFSGVVRLPDGSYVVTDMANKRCSLLDASLKVATAFVPLNSSPTDLTVIGPTDVMVALPESKALQCVSIVGTEMSVTKHIACQRAPRSVCRVSDTEVAVGWDSGLGIVSLDGKEKSYINTDQNGDSICFTDHDHITVDATNRRCYRSDWNSGVVSCLDFDGKVHFNYTSGLRCPAGVTVDRDGNVYICSYGRRTVHQVSPEGEMIREITADMNNPYLICFKPDEDEMMVIDYYGSQALKVRFVPPE